MVDTIMPLVTQYVRQKNDKILITGHNTLTIFLRISKYIVYKTFNPNWNTNLGIELLQTYLVLLDSLIY